MPYTYYNELFYEVLSIVMRKLVCRLWLNEVSRQ